MTAEVIRNIKKFGCKLCLFEFRMFEENKSWFYTLEELMCHMEEVHDIVLPRKGETEEHAWDRCKAKGNKSGTSQCRCNLCRWNLRDSEISQQLRNDGLVIPKNGMDYFKELDDVMIEFALPYSGNGNGKVK